VLDDDRRASAPSQDRGRRTISGADFIRFTPTSCLSLILRCELFPAARSEASHDSRPFRLEDVLDVAFDRGAPVDPPPPPAPRGNERPGESLHSLDGVYLSLRTGVGTRTSSPPSKGKHLLPRARRTFVFHGVKTRHPPVKFHQPGSTLLSVHLRAAAFALLALSF